MTTSTMTHTRFVSVKKAILNGFTKKVNNGSNYVQLEEYKEELKNSWCNETMIIDFLNGLDLSMFY